IVQPKPIAVHPSTPALVEAAPATPKVIVPIPVLRAVQDYLRAPRWKDSKELKAALDAVGDDLALATAALRNRPPLASAEPGTHHGLMFYGDQRSRNYSINLRT